jgi:hypothetical protein
MAAPLPDATILHRECKKESRDGLGFFRLKNEGQQRVIEQKNIEPKYLDGLFKKTQQNPHDPVSYTLTPSMNVETKHHRGLSTFTACRKATVNNIRLPLPLSLDPNFIADQVDYKGERYDVWTCYTITVGDLKQSNFHAVNDNNPPGHVTIAPRVDVSIDKFDTNRKHGWIDEIIDLPWVKCGYFLMKAQAEAPDMYHPDPDMQIAVSALYERYLTCQDSDEVQDILSLIEQLTAIPPPADLTSFVATVEGKLDIIVVEAIQQYGGLCQNSGEAMDALELARKLTQVKPRACD